MSETCALIIFGVMVVSIVVFMAYFIPRIARYSQKHGADFIKKDE